MTVERGRDVALVLGRLRVPKRVPGTLCVLPQAVRLAGIDAAEKLRKPGIKQGQFLAHRDQVVVVEPLMVTIEHIGRHVL